MKRLPFYNLPLITLLFSSTVAHAHPGHGFLDSWAHIFEPDHLLPALGVIALLIYALIHRKTRQKN